MCVGEVYASFLREDSGNKQGFQTPLPFRVKENGEGERAEGVALADEHYSGADEVEKYHIFDALRRERCYK
jgi:hypothetical protein